MAKQPTRLNPDDSAELRKLYSAFRSLLERFSRQSEEYDQNRLANEEIRELIKDLIDESGRFADGLSRRMDRIEQYVILKGMDPSGYGRQTLQIEAGVAREHIDRALREELVNQQQIVLQYQKNISRVKLSIAKYGETTPLVNELEEYEMKVEKATEAIARIRENLG